MGRICAWCGSLLSCHASQSGHVGHAICEGCVAELEASLSSVGLRLSKPGGQGSARAPQRAGG